MSNIFASCVSFTAHTNERLQQLLSAFHLVFDVVENSSKKTWIYFCWNIGRYFFNALTNMRLFITLWKPIKSLENSNDSRKTYDYKDKMMISIMNEESCSQAYLRP